jgi:hypothetical protein
MRTVNRLNRIGGGGGGSSSPTTQVMLPLDTYTEFGVSPGVDLLLGSGPVTITMTVVSTTGGAEVVSSFDSSPDGVFWTGISDPEAFTFLPGPGVTQAVFERPQRYMRAQWSLSGEEGATADFSVDVTH